MHSSTGPPRDSKPLLHVSRETKSYHSCAEQLDEQVFTTHLVLDC